MPRWSRANGRCSTRRRPAARARRAPDESRKRQRRAKAMGRMGRMRPVRPIALLGAADADRIRRTTMPTLIEAPMRIEAAGNKPKRIGEYIGRARSGHDRVSVAHMRSPGGWVEPGQTPEFEEFTVVLRGLLRVTHRGGVLDVRAGQAVVAHPGEWVQYSTPEPEGAEYIAVCVPAFALE